MEPNDLRRRREWALSATAAGDEKRERDKGENRERREQRICEEQRPCFRVGNEKSHPAAIS